MANQDNVAIVTIHSNGILFDSERYELAEVIKGLLNGDLASNAKESGKGDPFSKPFRALVRHHEAPWGAAGNDYMPATVTPCDDHRWFVLWDHGIKPGHKWSSKGLPKHYDWIPFVETDVEKDQTIAMLSQQLADKKEIIRRLTQ